MRESDGKYPEVLKSLTIADRRYELVTRYCANCEQDHFQVFRWCGVSFSRYFFAPEFDANDFEAFVELIDETLLEASADLIQQFHNELCKVHSAYGISANSSFAFRILEYGRHRASALSKLGMMEVLLSKTEPKDDKERAVRLAFELGVAVSEHKVMDVYEDYMLDGMAVSEWRENGLPKARLERLRQGERSRSAILTAAKELYTKNPDLVRNDTETARAILKRELPELQKGNGQQLGLDAVTKHLRQGRKQHCQ